MFDTGHSCVVTFGEQAQAKRQSVHRWHREMTNKKPPVENGRLRPLTNPSIFSAGFSVSG